MLNIYVLLLLYCYCKYFITNDFITRFQPRWAVTPLLQQNLQNKQAHMDHLVFIHIKSGNNCQKKPHCFHQISSHQIMKLAVYGMLPKNLHRRTMMQRLHLFPEDVSWEPLHLPQPVKFHITWWCYRVMGWVISAGLWWDSLNVGTWWEMVKAVRL